MLPLLFVGSIVFVTACAAAIGYGLDHAAAVDRRESPEEHGEA